VENEDIKKAIVALEKAVKMINKIMKDIDPKLIKEILLDHKESIDAISSFSVREKNKVVEIDERLKSVEEKLKSKESIYIQ